MIVHLVDGTYELFRHFFAVPSHVTVDGREVGAVRATVGSVLSMLEGGATHVGVATDHVIESFRNEMWEGYKSGADLPSDLEVQFEPLELTLAALGLTVWPMVDHEADDALASAAAVAAADDRVDRVLICTPDKDLAQCVVDPTVVQFDRRADVEFDEAGVVAKFGVPPASIPDYLALVGDSADGFPGLRGWGAKSTATVLARYGHVEQIPLDEEEWDIKVRGAAGLAATLRDDLELALLFRKIATVDRTAPTIANVDECAWQGATGDAEEACAAIDGDRLLERVRALETALAR